MINSTDLLSQFAAANKNVCVFVCTLMVHEMSSAGWRVHIARKQMCALNWKILQKLFVEI